MSVSESAGADGARGGLLSETAESGQSDEIHYENPESQTL